jgi:hypothetical protein
MRIFPYLLLTVLLFSTSVYAESSAVASVNQRLVELGTTFQVKLIVRTEKGLRVERPTWPEPSGLNIVNPDFDMKTESGEFTFWAEYTSTESGNYEIAPIRVIIRDDEGIIEDVISNPVEVEITGDAPKPSSGIIPAPGFDWQKYLLIGLSLAVLAGLIAYWINLRRSLAATPVIGGAPVASKSLEQEIIQEIEGLQFPDASDKEAVKGYYMKVDGILRKYMNIRYEVDTVDTTTWEIQLELKSRQRMDTRVQDIFKLLNDCNWVKYAKLHPTNDDIHDIPNRCMEALTGLKKE